MSEISDPTQAHFDGDIVFRSPSKEILRLRGRDGAILVHGKVVEFDRQVVSAFRVWVRGCKVTREGDTTFSVGMAGPGGCGGNVVLHADEEPPCEVTK